MALHRPVAGAGGAAACTEALRRIARAVLEGLLLKHAARQWAGPAAKATPATTARQAKRQEGQETKRGAAK